MMMMMMLMMMMPLTPISENHHHEQIQTRDVRERVSFVVPRKRENENDCEETRPIVNEMWNGMAAGEGSYEDAMRQFINLTDMYQCADAPFSAGVLALFGGRLDLSSKFHVESVTRSRGLQRRLAPVARYKSSSMRRIMRQGLDLRVASRAKIRHDAEQIRYLVSENLISSSYLDAARTLERMYSSLSENWIGYLPNEMYKNVRTYFNRLLYYNPPDRLPEGESMFGHVDLIRAREEYRTRQITVVDNLLSPRALRILRKWLMESTFWFDSNPQGYVGAYFEQGFTSPFLLQMVQELKTTFRKILGPHKLNEVWAYKYVVFEPQIRITHSINSKHTKVRF